MTDSTDRRKAAELRVRDLTSMLQGLEPSETRDRLLQECEALGVAIAAFHMEGIRFRMFNVDRLLNKGAIQLPAAALTAFAEVRQHLEAAGFHTRSHQAPQ